MFFLIQQKIPSMNEVIEANRRNKYAGAKLKRETEEMIGLYINIARRQGKIRPVNTPVIIRIEWHEKTKRRDVDNIQSGQKFILDALQKQGILVNDNRRYVKQVYHEIVDDAEDFVEVIIEKGTKQNESDRLQYLSEEDK